MDKVIFIDRDGVINKDPGGWTTHNYVTRWEEFIFLPGVIEALRRLKEAGYTVLIISNQAGINKGYFTRAALDDLTGRMLAEIRRGGGDVDGVYYCPHRAKDNCGCRKPKAGLFKKAAGHREIDWAGTYFIGDSYRDVAAGREMGMKTVFVLSGKTAVKETEKWPQKPDYVRNDLPEAVEMILKGARG